MYFINLYGKILRFRKKNLKIVIVISIIPPWLVPKKREFLLTKVRLGKTCQIIGKK
jgi:hypothetical protein